MNYFGDIRLGNTIDIKFTTVSSTGAPTTLAGTPVISAYVGNGTTEITAGITLTVDFDSRTGLNNVRVVASSGNGFATATDVILVITTGTISGVSAVGYVIGSFSIENRSAVMPVTAGRQIAIDASNQVSVGALANNVITTAAINNGALTTAKLGASFFDGVWSVGTRVLTAGTNIVLAKGTGVTGFNDLDAAGIRGAVGLASANLDTQLSGKATASALSTAQADLDILTGTDGVTLATSQPNYAPNTVTPLDAAGVRSAVGLASANLDTQFSDLNTLLNTTGIVVLTNNDKTGYAIGTGGIDSVSFAAGAIDASALAASAGQEIADEILNRDIVGSVSGGARNVRSAFRAIRNRVVSSGGTLTVYEEDDTTPAWTAAVSRSAVDPIVEINP